MNQASQNYLPFDHSSYATDGERRKAIGASTLVRDSGGLAPSLAHLNKERDGHRQAAINA